MQESTVKKQAEEKAPQEPEQRARAGAEQRRVAGREAARDLLDVAQAGADDRHVLDWEVVVGEEVDGALSGLVARDGGDGAPAGGRRGGGGAHRLPWRLRLRSRENSMMAITRLSQGWRLWSLGIEP